MSEILTPPEDITKGVKQFGERLAWFFPSTDFPDNLLAEPDHIMIKSADPADFDRKVNGIKPFAQRQEVAFMQLDWRFLVAAHLLVPMALMSRRPINWLEVMEPKSTEGTTDYIGVEYAGFYYPDFNRAQQDLIDRGVSFQYREDGSHRWLNVPVNDVGQEVRISDTKLIKIVDDELQDGTAKLI